MSSALTYKIARYPEHGVNFKWSFSQNLPCTYPLWREIGESCTNDIKKSLSVTLEPLICGNIWPVKCEVSECYCMRSAGCASKSSPGKFLFWAPIFPRCQKILSLQKQWEALRKMKAWVGMETTLCFMLRSVFLLQSIAGCLDCTRKESKNAFFILETTWNYHIRTVAFHVPYVPQFDFLCGTILIMIF